MNDPQRWLADLKSESLQNSSLQNAKSPEFDAAAGRHGLEPALQEQLGRLLLTRPQFRPLDAAAASRVRQGLIAAGAVGPGAAAGLGGTPDGTLAGIAGRARRLLTQSGSNVSLRQAASLLGTAGAGALLVLASGWATEKRAGPVGGSSRDPEFETRINSSDSEATVENGSQRAGAATPRANAAAAQADDPQHFGKPRFNNAAYSGNTAPLTAARRNLEASWAMDHFRTPSDPWSAWLWDRLGCANLDSSQLSANAYFTASLAPASLKAVPLTTGSLTAGSLTAGPEYFLTTDGGRALLEQAATCPWLTPGGAVAQGDSALAFSESAFSRGGVADTSGANGSLGARVDLTAPGARLGAAGSLTASCADLGAAGCDSTRSRTFGPKRTSRLGSPRRGASSEDVSDLREETLLLEAARVDLARNPRRALAVASEHQTRFAKGQLAPQRALIQIEAYLRLGQDARAMALYRGISSSLFRDRAGSLLRRYGAL